jgi:hypothetical protein
VARCSRRKMSGSTHGARYISKMCKLKSFAPLLALLAWGAGIVLSVWELQQERDGALAVPPLPADAENSAEIHALTLDELQRARARHKTHLFIAS